MSGFGRVVAIIFGGLFVLIGGGCTMGILYALVQSPGDWQAMGGLLLLSAVTLALGVLLLRKAFRDGGK